MRIQQQRKVQIEASRQEVCARVNAWAAHCGFVLETLADDQLVFAKGSSWHAIYTFDIQKLPTRVSIILSGEAPTGVDCTFGVESLFSISTPGDAKKVSEQLDLLIAYLNDTLH